MSERSEDYSPGWRQAAGPGCGHVMNQTGYKGLEMSLIWVCLAQSLWLQFCSKANTRFSGGRSSFHHSGSGGRGMRRFKKGGQKKKKKKKK